MFSPEEFVPRHYDVEERKEKVLLWNSAGISDSRIAQCAMVSTKTIQRDRKEMNIPRWAEIDDEEVLSCVTKCKTDNSQYVGRDTVEGYMAACALPVQQRRIRKAQVAAGVLQPKVKRLERLAWYEGVGVDWVW